MKKLDFIVTLGLSALLAACGGGGGGTPGTNTAEVDQISNVTLNPAAAVQSLYTATANYPSIQYSAGTPEVLNGITYQVQNVLSIDSNGNSQSSKRYYTLNPFTIYTPSYYFKPSPTISGLPAEKYTVVRTVGTLPVAAKVGDFGLYETATITYFDGMFITSSPSQATSAWTLTKESNTTALFCYGASNNLALTIKTCYKLNARGEVV